MSAAVPDPFLSGLLAALQRPVASASSDQYLRQILTRESVLRGLLSPVGQASAILTPIIQDWGKPYVSYVAPSGSFAKGTANRSGGCDLDLLISLQSSCSVPLGDICASLRDRLRASKLPAIVQNASVGTRIGTLNVDLVPARQHSSWGNDHSIYNKRTGTWRKTNVQRHIHVVSLSGCVDEIRLLKLWRDQLGLDFPSFVLELSVIRALKGDWYGTLSSRFLKALDFFAHELAGARIADPANPSNIVSDDLSLAAKIRIRDAARRSLTLTWNGIVR